jgi:hypothetical protein
MKRIVFIIVCFIGIKFATAQFYEPLDYVKLKFGTFINNSIPYDLTIELFIYYSEDKPIKAIVHSSSGNNNKKFEYSNIDTSFFVDKDKFYKILDLLKSIPPSDIYSEYTLGCDGTDIIIEFGHFQNYVSYKVWTPDYKTKERKLEAFLNACKMIIEIVNLNPDNIFTIH